MGIHDYHQGVVSRFGALRAPKNGAVVISVYQPIGARPYVVQHIVRVTRLVGLLGRLFGRKPIGPDSATKC